MMEDHSFSSLHISLQLSRHQLYVFLRCNKPEGSEIMFDKFNNMLNMKIIVENLSVEEKDK